MSNNNPNGFKSVLVTGGGGYVGSALVPELVRQGYHVKVVDVFWYGKDVFGEDNQHPELERLDLDIRDSAQLKQALKGVDAVIHLACISNDPSFELDPGLGKSINYDAFTGLLQGAIDQGVHRFIYASSSSIYGVKETPDVREDAEPLPLTDYSRFKLDCERDLLAHSKANGMERVIVRPATICGYAPRLRLDLTVNILTINALVNHKIRIFGGKQLRPNLHIKDMVRAYLALLEAPGKKIEREAFNVGFQNRSVEDIARMVRDTLRDPTIELEYTPTNDNRSYHVNSEKIKRVLGFETRHTIEDAIADIADAFRRGLLKEPLTNPIYSNIKRMQQLQVK
ncbi:MAG TPA: NAD-dependent epimerase/dehydratase [Candidatus Binatia bacterium]|jgi:nucleoside-diphosphate-sugar epimerase|nr:NAD-dependent epimerase/dehydratase [Candidatus Binatia bacterium]